MMLLAITLHAAHNIEKNIFVWRMKQTSVETYCLAVLSQIPPIELC